MTITAKYTNKVKKALNSNQKHLKSLNSKSSYHI